MDESDTEHTNHVNPDPVKKFGSKHHYKQHLCPSQRSLAGSFALLTSLSSRLTLPSPRSPSTRDSPALLSQLLLLDIADDAPTSMEPLCAFGTKPATIAPCFPRQSTAAQLNLTTAVDIMEDFADNMTWVTGVTTTTYVHEDTGRYTASPGALARALFSTSYKPPLLLT